MLRYDHTQQMPNIPCWGEGSSSDSSYSWCSWWILQISSFFLCAYGLFTGWLHLGAHALGVFSPSCWYYGGVCHFVIFEKLKNYMEFRKKKFDFVLKHSVVCLQIQICIAVPITVYVVQIWHNLFLLYCNCSLIYKCQT